MQGGFATSGLPCFSSTLILILCGTDRASMLEAPEDNLQATWDEDSMLPIIWTGEASHVTPTYLPPPDIGDFGVTRLPEDYYFLPISSPIQRSQCVFPCTIRTQPYIQGENSLYASSASDEVSQAASEQDDKVIVIHEHHHHHHHRNVTDDDQAETLDIITYTDEEEEPSDYYTQGPRSEYVEPSSSFYTGESRNEEEPSDFYTQGPRAEYVEPSSFYTGESRNEASESQQHFSKESLDNKSLKKKKAFKNFFYKFYETLRRRAAQDKKRIQYKENVIKDAVYDEEEEYDEAEGKEASDDFDDGFKAIKVHAVEIDPFVEEGFEPILEYELD